MATLDLRKHADGACFGCGQEVDGTASAVWAAPGGPVVALLCDACRADEAVREALAGHLIAHMKRGRERIEWETGDPAAPLAFGPATKATLLERLAACQGFVFIQ